MYKVIADENELKFFWKYGMAPLKENEVYFVSVSYRNKNLTDKEREYFGLGRSEMCDAECIRKDSYLELYKQLRRWEYHEDGALSKTGVPKPQKCRRIYINICPIDIISASRDLLTEIQKFHIGLANSAINHSPGGITENLYGLKKIMASSRSIYARNFGTKTWVDIDADFSYEGTHDCFFEIVQKLNSDFGIGNIMAIRMKGGAHFLVRKSQLSYNLISICLDIRRILVENNIPVKEVVRNNNEMINIPGTFVGDTFSPFVLNKDDFKFIPPFHLDSEL